MHGDLKMVSEIMTHDEITELKKKSIEEQLDDIDSLINREEDYY